MTYGESIGEHGRLLFEKAAFELFVEIQKAGHFTLSNAFADADMACALAQAFIYITKKSLAVEVGDFDSQEEGGKQ